MTHTTYFPLCIIQGDSMQPVYQDGDLIIAKSARDIKKGDVIIFKKPGHRFFVIHRVIRQETQQMVTKGDANSHPDPCSLNCDQVIGKVWLRIPKIGNILRIIQRRRITPCPL